MEAILGTGKRLKPEFWGTRESEMYSAVDNSASDAPCENFV